MYRSQPWYSNFLVRVADDVSLAEVCDGWGEFRSSYVLQKGFDFQDDVPAVFDDVSNSLFSYACLVDFVGEHARQVEFDG